MKKLEKLQLYGRQLTQSLASLIKVVLMSKAPSAKSRQSKDTVIIMGNGPSLRDAIENHFDALMKYPRLAVNFAAITPDFMRLQPEYYVLADGVFFTPDSSGKVAQLWEAIRHVTWEMTLYVPASFKHYPALKTLQNNITVKYYNLTPAEGFNSMVYPLYDKGMAMPRPRNVLIPSIMCAVREGFHRIILTGADHNWSQTLWVSDRNTVVSVQPHFYKDDEAELQRAEALYRNIRLHEIYESFAVAFRSYHQLRAYLDSRGITVLNATPGSFIDAFDRISLKED